MDTTGWWQKVVEGRREVGAPDLDQVNLLQYDSVGEAGKDSNATSSRGVPRQQAHTCSEGTRDTGVYF